MNGLSFQGSYHNLTQVDKLQQQESNTPINNQEQSAKLEQEKTVRKLETPVEPEQIDEKRVDPENKKEYPKAKPKQKQRKKKVKRKPLSKRIKKSGNCIDFSA